MRKLLLLSYCITLAILSVGCTGPGGDNRTPQSADTLYSAENVREIFHQSPERALVIIDSAERLGTMNRIEATLLRAHFYSEDEATMDTARTLCMQLLAEGGLKAGQQAEALDILVYVARMRCDDEGILKYGMQYIEVCRQMGNEAEALFMQSEMGEALIRLGRTDEGFAKMDDAIAQLDPVRRFAEFDACIRAMKRKINALLDRKCYEDVIPVAQRIVEKLSDYGEHPADYDDGANHMPTEERRPGYIDFYTGQAYAFMAYAYAMKDSGDSGHSGHSGKSGFSGEAKRCLALFNQTAYSNTVGGRKMISSTWCLLGEYDKMLAFYDELEPKWGADTLHGDYAIMLRNRATAARAKGNYRASDAYMQRYASLQKTLGDSERQTTAQEYAARYHEQEQQLALEQEQAAKKRMGMVVVFLGTLAMVVTVSLVLLIRQLRDIRKKNAVLSKEISERIGYEEKYLSLVGGPQFSTPHPPSRGDESPNNQFSQGDESPNNQFSQGDESPNNQFSQGDESPNNQFSGGDESPNCFPPLRGDEGGCPAPTNPPLSTENLEELSDSELFDYIRKVVSDENLHLDPQFGRDQLVERLQLSKERIGAAFAQGSDYGNIINFLNDARLFHSTKLLTEHPEMSIEDVALASGFSNRVTFSRNFKDRFAMSPSEFRVKN